MSTIAQQQSPELVQGTKGITDCPHLSTFPRSVMILRLSLAVRPFGKTDCPFLFGTASVQTAPISSRFSHPFLPRKNRLSLSIPAPAKNRLSPSPPGNRTTSFGKIDCPFLYGPSLRKNRLSLSIRKELQTVPFYSPITFPTFGKIDCPFLFARVRRGITDCPFLAGTGRRRLTGILAVVGF